MERLAYGSEQVHQLRQVLEEAVDQVNQAAKNLIKGSLQKIQDAVTNGTQQFAELA